MHEQQEKPKFELNFIKPFSTFNDGKPIEIPYVIDGLLTQGGFSALAAKPKHGKSSFSRCEAVAVAKGTDFLGRKTTQGEVILASLEDPRNHVDNCLSVLGYDPSNDARIHILEKLPPSIEETVDVLGDALIRMSDIRLIVIDTLAKALRVKDLSDYMITLTAVEKLRDLARKFPKLHIQGLAHCKKIETDDPFDGILGSTALRGEPDCNIVLFDQQRQRLIQTETRIGRSIPPTIFRAELVTSAGEDVIRSLSLDASFDDWKQKDTAKKGKRKAQTYEQRVIEFLLNRGNYVACQEVVLDEVEGKRECLIEAIGRLQNEGVVEVTGVKNSRINPTTLRLKVDALNMYKFVSRFDGRVN